MKASRPSSLLRWTSSVSPAHRSERGPSVASDFGVVLVDADDVVAGLGQTGAQHQTHISGTTTAIFIAPHFPVLAASKPFSVSPAGMCCQHTEPQGLVGVYAYAVRSVRILLDYRPALRERTGVGEFVHELARALATDGDRRGRDDQLAS